MGGTHFNTQGGRTNISIDGDGGGAWGGDRAKHNYRNLSVTIMSENNEFCLMICQHMFLQIGICAPFVRANITGIYPSFMNSPLVVLQRI